MLSAASALQVLLGQLLTSALANYVPMDPCRNTLDVLFGIEALNCLTVTSNLVPIANCSVLGMLCPVTCGLCPPWMQFQCDAAEVYEQKSHLAEVLRGWGVCDDCEAPQTWTTHHYVLTAPQPHTGAPMGTWTSTTPGDPCAVNGVVCNRCGEPIALYLGAPRGEFYVTNHTPRGFFQLHALEEVFIAAQSSGLPAVTDPSGHYIPAALWQGLPNLFILLMTDAFTGEVPHLSSLPRLASITMNSNRLFGDAVPLFGAPNLLSLQVVQTWPLLSPGPLPDTVCMMRLCTAMTLIGLSLVGPIPECFDQPLSTALHIYATPGMGVLTGPIAKLLTSPRMRDFRVDGNHLTGTLPQSLSLGSALERFAFIGNKVSGTIPDLSNHTGLLLIEVQGNQLVGVGPVTGINLRLNLADNLIEEFPPAFWSLPSTGFLDLSRNRLRYWPPAGVYNRGLWGPDSTVPSRCFEPPKAPAFDWPEMSVVLLSGNDLQGQEARDVLGSLAGVPALRTVEANDCNMSGDIPLEGRLMLKQFDAENCDLASFAGAFLNLNSLRVSGNAITGLYGVPFRVLQIFEIANNNLIYMHPSWFEAGSNLITQNYVNNPDLRLPIRLPAGSICHDDHPLTMNPQLFVLPDEDAGYECTSLCNEKGISILISSTADSDALCRCRPGWYGSGNNCAICEMGFYCPGATGLPSQCPGNSTTSGNGSSLETDCECNPGYYRIYNPPDPLFCQPCPANHYRPFSSARSEGECFKCDLDTMSDPGTVDGCDDCPNGTEPLGSGAGCRTCPAGTKADSLTKTCVDCPVGQFQPEAGKTECIQCAGEGNTTWELIETSQISVPRIRTTDGRHCGCEAGRRPVGGVCVACGSGEQEGLRCAGGLSETAVTVLPGYFSEASPISVYRCWGDSERCKGGLPGETCQNRRRELTCARCDDGFVEGAGGSCDKCAGDSTLRFTIAVAVVLLCLVGFYYAIDQHSRPKQKNSELLLSSLLSLTVTVMQQLGLLSETVIEWKDPLKSLLSGFLVLNLNLEVVHVDCVNNLGAFSRFLITITMIFTFCAVMIVIHVAFVVIRYKGRFKDRRSSLVCSLGGVATLFYISVVVTIAGPLQCQEHPNGKWTSRSYPSVVCWGSSEHTNMVVASLIALLLPLGYYAHAAYTVWNYPARVHMGDIDYMKAFEFYFVRFTVESYWFILVQIGRNLVLACTVMIPEGAVAIFVALMVINFYGFTTALCCPWRAHAANHIDAILTISVMVLFSAGFRFMPVTSSTDDVISWICTLSVILVVGMLPLLCAAILIRKYVFHQKRFAYFLCHHKAGAGAFCRLLKNFLVRHRRGCFSSQTDVFLDSDSLAHLDQLFHHVRSETERLVAVWSRDLLLRPWCAGEITIARLTHVRTQTIIMPDHMPVTPEFEERFLESVDLSQIHEYGLTFEMIIESLSWLGQQPSVTMADAPSPKVMEDLVSHLQTKLFKVGHRVSNSMLKYTPGPVKEEAPCIVADEHNSEAISSAMVLERYLVQLQAAGSDIFVLPIDASLPRSVTAVVFICTGGCLESEPYLRAVEYAAAHKLASALVVAQDSFRFPAAEKIMQMKPPNGGEAFHQYLITLFKEIAVVFHAQHASDSSLKLGATTLSNRLSGRGSAPGILVKATSSAKNLARRGSALASGQLGSSGSLQAGNSGNFMRVSASSSLTTRTMADISASDKPSDRPSEKLSDKHSEKHQEKVAEGASPDALKPTKMAQKPHEKWQIEC